MLNYLTVLVFTETIIVHYSLLWLSKYLQLATSTSVNILVNYSFSPLLQCNYYNGGHLDKVDQWIRLQENNNTFQESKLSVIITTKQNQQHGSKSTNKNNLQTWSFEPTEESTCFLRGPLEWVTDAKNVNNSYLFYLWFQVVAKCGNRSKEIARRWQNNSLCQRNRSPGCCTQSFE